MVKRLNMKRVSHGDWLNKDIVSLPTFNMKRGSHSDWPDENIVGRLTGQLGKYVGPGWGF